MERETRLNFTSNGTGNFLPGDEEGRRRGFTSSQALRTRHVTIFKATGCWCIPLPLFIPLSLPRSLSPSRGRDLLTCTETFNFARRDGHWISPTNRIIRANFLPFSLSGLSWKSLRPSSPLPPLSRTLSMENWLLSRLNGLNNQRDFIRRFLSMNRKSLLLFISIFGLLDFFFF